METLNTTLFGTEGTSDKEYRIELKPAGAGYIVNFAFGRRGTTLKPGTKTQSPVAYEIARGINDKLVQEKQQKDIPPVKTKPHICFPKTKVGFPDCCHNC